MSTPSNEAILELWKGKRTSLGKFAREELYVKWIKNGDYYKLYTALNNEQRSILENFIDQASEKYLSGIDEAFVIGFKKGMRLAIEVIWDNEVDKKD